MFTYLEVSNGPDKGVLYRVRPNLRLGSGDCDVRIIDSSIPEIHSQVLIDHREQLVLVCTNAVYEAKINGRAVKKVLLLNGTTFQIGNTQFKITIANIRNPMALDPLLPREEPISSQEIELDPFKFNEPESTQNILKNELERVLIRSKNPALPIHFRLFRRPLLLKVIVGPQADDEFFVSWGPRDFGPLALEFPIEFPPFPGILFTLTPTESGGILYSTQHSDFSRVSGQREPSCVINFGDKIEAGNSIIYIHEVEESDVHDKD